MLKIIVLCFFVFIGCSRNISSTYETALSNPNTVVFTSTEVLNTEVFNTSVEAEQREIAVIPIAAEVIDQIIDIHRIITSDFTEIRDVQFWNESMQTALYVHLLGNNNLSAALEFRAFMEALDREIAEASGNIHMFSSLHPRPHLINPVIVLMDNSIWGGQPFTSSVMDFIYAIYEERPDLFFQGNRGDWGHSGDMYSHLPLIQAVRNRNRDVIRFFVENVDGWKDMYSLNNWHFLSMVEWDIGLGGNLLSYLPEMQNRQIHNFLVEHGIEEYTNIGLPIFVNRRLDGTNVWSGPSFNSEVIRRIGVEERLEPIKITTYIVDGRRWVNFRLEDGATGWAPFGWNIQYESGR
jgi:hypothetical protein